MSTPTPSHSTTSKKVPAHVTTPSHLGLSSPAPRSMPSPAAARKDQAGKTPISSGSKTLGGTPMVHNLSQTGMTFNSSPGPLAGGLGTPLAGLGLDIGSATPGMLNLPTPLIGSSMMPSMSELGLSGSGTKRNEDEERRLRMKKVLRSIGRPKGRVSEEGITRVARRVGFQNDVDSEKLTPAERERKVGNRAIGIGGKTVLIEVDLKNHVAQSVQVMFNGEAKSLAEQGEAAGEVLLQDLAIPHGITLNAKLEHFAVNLDRLARLDRLSSDRLSCFEAISGIYTSLRRLFEVEKEAAKTVQGTGKTRDERDAESHVMCKGSGRPSIHGRSVIGLAIDYWGSETITSVKDGQRPTSNEASHQETTPSTAPTHSLRIEVEHEPTALYPPIRVSDAWLPDTFGLPGPDSLEGIPWQDPPPTYLASDSISVDGAQKLPDLNFIAKLDPPLVLPIQIAIALLSSLGVPPPPMYSYTQFHALLLNRFAHLSNIGSIETVTADRAVLSRRSDAESTVQQHYVLDVPKPDIGFRLKELPFSHPRQLIEILPLLRQWAHFNATLLHMFHASVAPTTLLTTAPSKPTTNLFSRKDGPVSLDDLLISSPDPTPPNHLSFDDSNPQISVSLSTASPPTLSFAFTNTPRRATQTIALQTLPNADIAVLSQGHSAFVASPADHAQPSPPQSAPDAEKSARHCAKALALCKGDVGVWIEWMRHR